MTAAPITTNIRHGQRVIHLVRRLALGIGWLVAGIGSRWNAFAESGQLGPSPYQELSRRTGARF